MAREAILRSSGVEGSDGNVRASHVWKGECRAAELPPGVSPESNMDLGVFVYGSKPGPRTSNQRCD